MVLLACQEEPHPGFAVSDSGLYYRLEVIGNEKKIESGNYVTVAYEVFADSSKRLKKSRKIFKLNEKVNDGGIVEGVGMMSEEDSMTFFMTAKNVYLKFIKESVPSAIRPTAEVKVGIKVEQVQTEEEFIAAKNKFREWLMTNEIDDQQMLLEEDAIARYIKSTEEEYSLTPNGLYYHVIQSGDGETPEFGKGVLIDYEGKTLDGKLFDSSYKRGQSFDFILGNEMQVLKGIEEGIFLMSTGAKYKFIIPSYLAYGDEGSVDGVIPPFSPVVYEVELLAIGK